MNPGERERAQRISDYVDALVVAQRAEDERPWYRSDDEEFVELAGLARELTHVSVEVPAGYGDDLRGRLPALLTEADRRPSWLARAGRRIVHSAEMASIGCLPRRRVSTRATAAAAVLVIVASSLLMQVSMVPVVSAAEVLSRCDRALATLVGKGEVLHRRWHAVVRSQAVSGRERVREWFADEWMDGSDFNRVAGRRYSTDNRLLLAYVSVLEQGEVRPRVYFAPGFLGEPRGLLSVEPSRREFQEAVAQFPPAEREALKTYLDRGYIYEPIAGERRFNRALLESTASSPKLPQFRLSLDGSNDLNGVPVYAVRIIEPVRINFLWRSDGPPDAWYFRQETVRYIARDTFLTLRSEETQTRPDGRRVVTTYELIETRITPAGLGGTNPFELDVPAGTPRQRQSALEQLKAVAAALAEVPVDVSERPETGLGWLAAR